MLERQPKRLLDQVGEVLWAPLCVRGREAA
jgi:hypothetical protein